MQKHLYIFHQQKKKELKQNIMWKTMIVEFNGTTVLIKRKLAFEAYLTVLDHNNMIFRKWNESKRKNLLEYKLTSRKLT